MSLGASLEQHAPAVGRYAWWSAWVGLVGGQLHALARHQTVDGKEDLDLSATAAWAEPAGDFLSPLLDWGDPDLVYVTYGKIWLPVFVGFFLCAVLVRHRRQPVGFERWAWRATLLGYGWAVVDVAAQYWTQWTGDYNALFEVAFLAGLPGLILTMVGSTVLGVTLLVKGFRPRVPAALLAATLPLLFAISMVTSLGNVVLPIAFAFAILGRRIAVDHNQAVPSPAGTHAPSAGLHV